VGHGGWNNRAGSVDYRVSTRAGAMGCDFSSETIMTTRRERQLVQEGEYLAEVDVDLIVTDDVWSPYLSDTDARKLDAVRRALIQGDIAAAAKQSRVFRLTPVHAA
jgi:hypothetical protein